MFHICSESKLTEKDLFQLAKTPEGIIEDYAAKIAALDQKNDYEKAYELCGQALADQRINQLAQAFMHLRRGDYEMRMGKYAQTEASIRSYLKWKQYFDKNKNL